jgi:hypothetical protein
MPLFKETKTPSHCKLAGTRAKFAWLTWSDPFRNQYKVFKTQLKRVGAIDFIYLKKYNAYNYTFDVNLSTLDPAFLDTFKAYALELLHFSPGERIIFFRDLIDDKINPQTFHFIFALFRSLMVDISRDKMAALYSPLTSGKDESDFPLHCDLYIPTILFNVFEKVASDGSGRSTFLQLETLFDEILPAVSTIPTAKKRKIREIIQSDRRKDRYEEFFMLLYDKSNPWSAELKSKMDKRKMSIKLEKGYGYMLHDRKWMHGRDAINGVPSKRLHRLIFTSDQA